MATGKTELILVKYDKLKGVIFEGTYGGTRSIEYEKGETTREIVVVSDANMKKIMSEIISSDPSDEVWKGITIRCGAYKFWAQQIEWGGDKDKDDTKSFKIIDVKSVSGLNWKRKEYESVINIMLEAV